MNKIEQILLALPDEQLRAAVLEVKELQSTGVLPQNVVVSVAHDIQAAIGITFTDALTIAQTGVMKLAAFKWAAPASIEPISLSYPAPTDGMEVLVHWKLRNGRMVDELSTSKVTKIGRKWVDLANGERFALGSHWVMDGKQYSSPGECYPSMAHYEATALRAKEYSAIRNRMGVIPPDSVGLGDIRQAAKLLRLSLDTI